MSASFATDSFFNWILSHPGVTEYIDFDSPDDPDDIKPRNKKLEETISKLKAFLEESKSCGPQIPTFPPLSPYLSKSQKFFSNVHFFIQFKIYRLRCKSQLEAHEIAEELITQLEIEKSQTKFTHLICVNLPGLYLYLQRDPLHAQMLATKDMYYVNEISSQMFIDTNKEKQIEFMHKVIADMRNSFNAQSVVIKEHTLQEQFERIIFYPEFIAYNEIRELVMPESMTEPILFTNSVIKTMNVIINKCNITHPTDITIFSVVYFRAIFNIAFRIKPEFFTNRKMEVKIRKVNDKITPQIAVADLYTIPNGNTIQEIVNNNEYIRKASDCLSKLPFMNSPLDSLEIINEALAYARTHITTVDKGHSSNAHSFDVVFGVFLVAVLGSDINNLEEVFWFINSFAPFDGLSGPLEYARATSSATALQLENISSELLKNP